MDFNWHITSRSPTIEEKTMTEKKFVYLLLTRLAIVIFMVVLLSATRCVSINVANPCPTECVPMINKDEDRTCDCSAKDDYNETHLIPQQPRLHK